MTLVEEEKNLLIVFLASEENLIESGTLVQLYWALHWIHHQEEVIACELLLSIW